MKVLLFCGKTGNMKTTVRVNVCNVGVSLLSYLGTNFLSYLLDVVFVMSFHDKIKKLIILCRSPIIFVLLCEIQNTENL